MKPVTEEDKRKELEDERNKHKERGAMRIMKKEAWR